MIKTSKCGIEVERPHRIVKKSKEAGTISMETAVSEKDAKIYTYKQFWLEYLNGIFREKILVAYIETCIFSHFARETIFPVNDNLGYVI